MQTWRQAYLGITVFAIGFFGTSVVLSQDSVTLWPGCATFGGQHRNCGTMMPSLEACYRCCERNCMDGSPQAHCKQSCDIHFS